MALMPKLLIFTAAALFTAIAVKVYMKTEDRDRAKESQLSAVSLTPAYGKLGETVAISLPAVSLPEPPAPVAAPPPAPEKKAAPVKEIAARPSHEGPLPEADRIAALFYLGQQKLPIVETITYKSHVPWQKGRPAWLSDYANHYATSRHFIARSLNGKPDYLKQELKEGDKFNVFKLDKPLSFYLVVDLMRCKMWFFYYDESVNERVLLKTYDVGVGREDPIAVSGFLTPLGCYRLGDRIATYKPKAMGVHNGQKQEMVRIFGTRWIPFSEEVHGCTASAKGFGIHGVPWVEQPSGMKEDISSIGHHESDGCIRLATADVEELFAIIVTKPTTIELVKDFWEAQLPGIEANY
jgi:hypothetical protein